MNGHPRTLRRTGLAAAAASVLIGAGLAVAPPAAAAAIVEDIECMFEPGDVPGVDVFFPGECRLVTTPSGRVNVVAEGQLPEGFTLERTHVGPIPCLGSTGRIVATPNGRVVATCHFEG